MRGLRIVTRLRSAWRFASSFDGTPVCSPTSSSTTITSASTLRSFSEGSDRLHSTDIAFKPAEAGWGGGSKYSQNFDDIFGKKKNNDDRAPSSTTGASNSTSKKDEN